MMPYYDWRTFQKIYILYQQQQTICTDTPVNDFESSLPPLPITIPTESLSLRHFQGWYRHLTLSRLLHLFHQVYLLLILLFLLH